MDDYLQRIRTNLDRALCIQVRPVDAFRRLLWSAVPADQVWMKHGHRFAQFLCRAVDSDVSESCVHGSGIWKAARLEGRQ